MRLTLTSQNWVKELTRRVEEFSNQVVKVRLRVPPDLKWWYYHEFGTVGGYYIFPKTAGFLRLSSAPGAGNHPSGSEAIVPWVGPPYTELHPGVHAKHVVGDIAKDLPAQLADKLGFAIRDSGWKLNTIRDVLITDFMPKVKRMITRAYDDALPNAKSENMGGKLHGQKASWVFEEQATIEEIND